MKWLEDLSEWLVATSVRGTLVALAIFGMQWLLRRGLPAAWRHALWLPLMLVLALPVLPKVPFGVLPGEVQGMTGREVATPLVEKVAGAEVVFTPETKMKSNWQWNPLAMIWLGGCGGLLGFSILAHRRVLGRMRAAKVPTCESLSRWVDEAVKEVGLAKAPEVMVSRGVESPAVTGVFRPVLLLPAGFPGSLGEGQARLILLHELMHLKRFDLPLNALSWVIQAMHWFNPVVWLAFSRMRVDREAACDAQVLALSGDDRRSDYGHALLTLHASMGPVRRCPGLVGIFESRSALKERIREIACPRRSHPAWAAVGVTCMGCLTLLGATQTRERGPRDTPRTPMAVGELDPSQVALEKCLDAVILPELHWKDCALEEAVDDLRTALRKAAEIAKAELPKEVSLMIRAPRGFQPKRVTFESDRVSLRKALEVVAESNGLRIEVGDTGIVLSPREAESMPKAPRTADAEMISAAKAIVVPEIELVGAALVEAVNQLNQQVREASAGEPAFVIRIDPQKVDEHQMLPELRFRKISVLEALKYYADATQTLLTAGEKEIWITRH
ncbi:beta-lactamase regulating signal transducer with metallopeptidase domain [Haloferula luteola]|uniref:Beta-lactamase regulating signal transducer with metallopeptidase domain n=1 Tax=Haloferula luteola TaxID=595692 RepID=A0A840V478_9BACT|nr:M56 family metallopeptidase [Haloferula luteola]MBB5352792.1 beta-lactamase regulating signal transducer with metallopeptidase domain [Haloferula luteola]